MSLAVALSPGVGGEANAVTASHGATGTSARLGAVEQGRTAPVSLAISGEGLSMASIERSVESADATANRTRIVPWRWFGVVPAIIDTLAITVTVLSFAIGYHQYRYHTLGDIWHHLAIVGLVALFFVVTSATQGHYSSANVAAVPRRAGGAFLAWNMAFLYATATIFAFKAGDEVSRVTVVGAYLLGFPLVVIGRLASARMMRVLMKQGRVAARRVLLFGTEDDVMRFARTYQPWNHGIQVVGMSTIARPTGGTVSSDRLDLDLERAVATARALHPDDVFVVVPWSDTRTIERTLDAFMNIPVSIHLAPERILDRFTDVRVSHIGSIASLNLARPPLTWLEILAKRTVDIVGAAVGLVLLAPVFAAIAIAIKLESRGPVLFRQTRYGFNQRPFAIYKFRSMSVLDDGEVIVQARLGDPRITGVGRFLRRWNLDELPQLVNVLFGQMSLVGPRPHAVAHNRSFEGRIGLYARRHNVRPGITGWAQVNGYRGETDTDDKMRARVEHDLYYIDNWSLFLDIKILVLTLLSPKSYRNAV